MSVSFGRPGREELVEFAKKANEIEIGGISDLADDMGMSLLTNQNKVNIGVRQESGQGETITIEPPRQQTSFSDNLEFVNLDAMETVGSMSQQPKIEIPNFSGSSEPFASQQPMVQPSEFVKTSLENQLTPEQEQKEKNSYLTRLQRLSSRGMGGQRMTMTNSLEEIKAEYGRVVDTRNLDASLKFQRNALMTFATGVEFMNNRLNPFDVNLEGWSESVHENVEDYDEIFEELYDKYKDAGKMPPEVRLVMTLGVSAAMFHVTNTYFKSKMPGMDDILRNNPDLMKQFATAAAGQVGPGFGQFVGAAMNTQRPQGPAGQAGMGSQGMGGMPFNMSSRASAAQQAQQQDELPMQQQQRPNLRREMRGPANVDDILQAFEQEKMNQGQPPSVNIDMNAAPIFAPSDLGSPQTMGMNILREGVGTDVDPLREVSNILDEMQSVASTSASQMDGERKGRRGRRSNAPSAGGTLTLDV